MARTRAPGRPFGQTSPVSHVGEQSFDGEVLVRTVGDFVGSMAPQARAYLDEVRNL